MQESKKANPSKFQLEEQIIAVPRNGNKKCGERRVIIHEARLSVPVYYPPTKMFVSRFCFQLSHNPPDTTGTVSFCVFHKVTQYNNYSNFVTNKNEKNFKLRSHYNFKLNSGNISCLPVRVSVASSIQVITILLKPSWLFLKTDTEMSALAESYSAWSVSKNCC